MQKVLFYLFFVAISAIWIMKTEQGAQSKTEVRKPPEYLGNSVLAKDDKKLEKNFKKKILANENWESINDYAVTSSSLVTREKSNALFEVSMESIHTLSTCLAKDFCGMEKKMMMMPILMN